MTIYKRHYMSKRKLFQRTSPFLLFSFQWNRQEQISLKVLPLLLCHLWWSPHNWCSLFFSTKSVVLTWGYFRQWLKPLGELFSLPLWTGKSARSVGSCLLWEKNHTELNTQDSIYFSMLRDKTSARNADHRQQQLLFLRLAILLPVFIVFWFQDPLWAVTCVLVWHLVW